MKTDREPSTEELQIRSMVARARVASDIEQLHLALEPAQLKERAFEAAERSAAHLGWRLLWRLSKAPQRFARYVKQHPTASASVGAALVALIGWRALARKRG
ncbi:MAG TPA: hypothetical protein VHB79_01240 [Polyangiaceae bacterium]|nr:hypothetical protein [Polyangiaceae bacterium]